MGVTFSHNLKFSKYNNLSVYKANRMLAVIKYTFSCLSPKGFCILYVTLVRSHLGYACVVWKRYLLYEIRASESVQRRVTRAVTTLAGMTYERLTFLNLPSLQYRRRKDLHY